MPDSIIKEEHLKDKRLLPSHKPIKLHKPPTILNSQRQANQLFDVLQQLLRRPEAHLPKVSLSIWEAIEHRLK